MAKKATQTQTQVTNNTPASVEAKPVVFTIETLFQAYKRLNLKKVCDTLGLCYQYVFKASKQPIEGKPYDSAATNYEAIDRILAKKGIILSDTDWAAVEATVQVFEPINKPEDFIVNETFFKIRGLNDISQVIYKTDEYIVFVPQILDDEANVVPGKPRVMNWDTFLHQSPRIVTLKEDK